MGQSCYFRVGAQSNYPPSAVLYTQKDRERERERDRERERERERNGKTDLVKRRVDYERDLYLNTQQCICETVVDSSAAFPNTLLPICLALKWEVAQQLQQSEGL